MLIAPATSRDLLKWKGDWKDQRIKIRFKWQFQEHVGEVDLRHSVVFSWIVCFAYNIKGKLGSQYCVWLVFQGCTIFSIAIS